MGIFTAYRDRRREISAVESIDTLEHMKDFFGDGETWRQGVYRANDGGRCLVGAANHVRVSRIDDAKHWLRVAIKEKTGQSCSIEQFNDTRGSFGEIRQVLNRAAELARANATKAVALVGEVMPPVRLALPAPAPITALPVVQGNRLPVAANPWDAPVQAEPAPARRQEHRAPEYHSPRPSLWDWKD
jgi:hypothetical protein